MVVRRWVAWATRASQACADRGVFVPAVLRRSGGAWPVRVSCLTADGDHAVPGHSTGLRAGGATGTCQWFPVAPPPPPSGQEMRAE